MGQDLGEGGGTAAMCGAVIGGRDGALGPRPGLKVPGFGFPVRRLLGLTITLAAFAAVALVGQAFGWLTDAQSATRAAQAADGQARLVVMALRQLTPTGQPGEARFAEVAPRLGALLVQDRYRGADDAVLTFQVTGHATSGAFAGRRPVTTLRCYAVDWRPPLVSDPAPVACPTLPEAPAGSPPADQLVQQLAAVGGLGSGPFLAVGVPGACAFGEESRSGFLAWPAPAMSRCDATEAARAAVFTV